MARDGTIRTEDLAYLAGLFDGEGCITWHRTKARNSNRIYSYPYCKISMTDKPGVELAYTLFGGSFRYRIRKELKKDGSFCKPIYIWIAQNRIGLRFLEAIFPFLLVKKDKALEAIVFYKNMDSNPHWRIRIREEPDIEKVLKLRRQGKTLQVIAYEMSTHLSTVQRVLLREMSSEEYKNLKIPPGTKKKIDT